MDQQQYDDNGIQQQRELTCYESNLDNCGAVAGCLRAWLPCICFICPYPFVVVQQSSIGLVERFGRYEKTIQSGLNHINPCTESVISVDLRTRVIDLPRQTIFTKDNVQVSIDSVVYYRIMNPIDATYKVQALTQSLQEMSSAALRQVCGEHVLQELLENREQMQENVETFMDQKTQMWGIYIDELFIKDMFLSKDMQSDIATAAKNKRIAQAKVISAKADVESAKLMREAADFLDNKAAMQIRFLETLQFIAKGPNPKIMFLPLSAESTASGKN